VHGVKKFTTVCFGVEAVLEGGEGYRVVAITGQIAVGHLLTMKEVVDGAYEAKGIVENDSYLDLIGGQTGNFTCKSGSIVAEMAII